MSNYVGVKELSNITGFSEPSIRYHLVYREESGLDVHVKRIGRKIVIDKDGFIDWLENGGGDKTAEARINRVGDPNKKHPNPKNDKHIINIQNGSKDFDVLYGLDNYGNLYIKNGRKWDLLIEGGL